MDRIKILYAADSLSKKVAECLENKIKNYHIPKAVMIKSSISSLEDVREDWLIVCCSPLTKNDEAIRQCIRETDPGHVLTVLVSGTPDESFPNELRFFKDAEGNIVECEPLAANLTADTEKESLKRLNIESLRLFAPMLGVSFDELNRRDLKRKRKIILIAGSPLVAAAAAFFIYAAIKRGEIGALNKSLTEQYEARQQALTEMEKKRDEAIYQDQLLASKKAREAYEKCDLMLALRYCINAMDEDSPEAAIPELKEIFAETLKAACASGYVPVTSKQEFYKTHEDHWELLLYANESTEETKMFPKEFKEQVSGELLQFIQKGEGSAIDAEITASFELLNCSEKSGFAIYNCVLRDDQLANTYYVGKVCFADDSSKDYYLKDENGELTSGYKMLSLDNGKILHMTFNNKMVQIDAATGFREQAFAEEEELDRLRKNSSVTAFFYTPDRKYFLIYEGNADGFEVYDPLTLKRKYKLQHECVDWNAHTIECLEDGNDYLIFEKSSIYIFDLKDGSLLSEVSTNDTAITGSDISSDGLLLITTDTRCRIWDISEKKYICDLPRPASENNTSAYFAGVKSQYDRFGSEWIDNNGIIFEYHENETPVPEDFSAKTALAKKLLSDFAE